MDHIRNFKRTISAWTVEFLLTESHLEITAQAPDVDYYLASIYANDALPSELQIIADNIQDLFQVIKEALPENLQLEKDMILIRNTMSKKQKWFQLPLERKAKSQLEMLKMEVKKLNKICELHIARIELVQRHSEKLQDQNKKLSETIIILQKKMKEEKQVVKKIEEKVQKKEESMNTPYHIEQIFGNEIRGKYGEKIELMNFRVLTQYKDYLTAKKMVGQKNDSFTKVKDNPQLKHHNIQLYSMTELPLNRNYFFTFLIKKANFGIAFGLTGESNIEKPNSVGKNKCIYFLLTETLCHAGYRPDPLKFDPPTLHVLENATISVAVNHEHLVIEFYVNGLMTQMVEFPPWMKHQRLFGFFEFSKVGTCICPNAY